jgi:tetratricopeptide (TPR) repeat protein
MFYFENNRQQKALPHLQRFLTILDKTKGTSNLNYATIQTVIGHIKRKQKEYNEAIECYNKALKIF